MSSRFPAWNSLVCSGVLFFLSAAGYGESPSKSGMPALGREWKGSDYVRAGEVISSGKVPMPLLADAEGQAFFKRMTAQENLIYITNTHAPIGARLDEFGKYLNGANAILMYYAAAANKGANVHTETAMIMSFILRIAQSGIVLIDEFVPLMKKDDTYETRLAGMRKSYSGMTKIFGGAEMSLGETSFYSREDLSLLLQAMADVLPIVKKAFSADYKAELRSKLEAHKAAFPDAKDAANLQKMIGGIGS